MTGETATQGYSPHTLAKPCPYVVEPGVEVTYVEGDTSTMRQATGDPVKGRVTGASRKTTRIGLSFDLTSTSASQTYAYGRFRFHATFRLVSPMGEINIGLAL